MNRSAYYIGAGLAAVCGIAMTVAVAMFWIALFATAWTWWFG